MGDLSLRCARQPATRIARAAPPRRAGPACRRPSLLAWYAYYRHRTGYIFGNPEFLRYNATSTLSPLRILLALAHRILQLTAHMNMFVPVLCMLGAMLLLPLRERDGTLRPRISPPDQAILYVVMVANILFFSVIGGALLTRYLLPLYPLILLLCVSTFYRRVPYWWGLVLLSAAAFLIGLFVNPPYKFAPEDNLNYADVIRLHQQAIRQIVTRFPGSTILTAWPATDELTKPELGYVKKPLAVVARGEFLPARDTESGCLRPGLQRRLRFFDQIRPSAPAAGSGRTQRGPRYPFLRFPSRSGARCDRPPSGWQNRLARRPPGGMGRGPALQSSQVASLHTDGVTSRER